jgi:excisionase family DNA binding protein
VKADRAVHTVNEVSKILGVHPLTVRRAIDRGEFPAIKVGRRVLIPTAAFESFLAKAGSNGGRPAGEDAGSQSRAAGRGAG